MTKKKPDIWTRTRNGALVPWTHEDAQTARLRLMAQFRRWLGELDPEELQTLTPLRLAEALRVLHRR
jgi:hypothetical protein